MVGNVLYRWSGQVLEPVDAIAFIGQNPGNEHIYIITGHSGNGMTYGTIGGMLITDLITKTDNPWAALYDPGRINVRSVTEFAKENLNVAEQYAQWLTPGDVGSIDDIPPGSGAVIRRGMRKLAVYKDETGRVTQCSAVCTHLYCIVDWNDTEKTWDCPCHGSRFDPQGHVITGPAIADLEPIPQEQPAAASSSPDKS
jgi:Rieske Fe-S protein